MAMKFFTGVNAGCIGHTENGYPITNYQLVMVKDDATGFLRVFQARKMRGLLNKDGVFEEVRPRTGRCVSSDDTVYDKPIYYVEGKEVSADDDRLITQFEIVEVTEAVKALAALPDVAGSPYFTKKCVKIFESQYVLDGRKKEDKCLIKAVKEAMTT